MSRREVRALAPGSRAMHRPRGEDRWASAADGAGHLVWAVRAKQFAHRHAGAEVVVAMHLASQVRIAGLVASLSHQTGSARSQAPLSGFGQS